MLANLATIGMTTFLIVFAMIVSVGLWYVRPDRDSRRGLSRLREVPGPMPEAVEEPRWKEPMPGLFATLSSWVMPDTNTDRLGTRLKRAGFHKPHMVRTFLGVKCLLLFLLPTLFSLLPYFAGLISGNFAIQIGLSAALIGLVAPETWLESARRKRQLQLRQALPDALDMLVLCLEGGISFSGALQRVTSELRFVHPLLAGEMELMQREIQMGLSAGEAMKKFGERCDLPDVKDLANVLLQSERYGAGVVKAIRLHADTCRQDRFQRAEETAQRASVKILFPTLLCIFPAIFIVILGPAAYQIANIFAK